MRLKLLKKYNTIFAIYSILMILGLVLSIVFSKKLGSNFIFVIIGLVLISIIFTWIIHYNELNEDKKIINEMVFNGEMALAHIESGKVEKIHKDSALKKYVIWKLDLTVYDHDNNKHRITTYEMCNPTVRSIPNGNIYVTYDPNNLEKMFVVPNMLVGAYEGNKDLILNYEKHVKNIKYLNVYYKEGIVIETFQQSMEKKMFDYKVAHDGKGIKE